MNMNRVIGQAVLLSETLLTMTATVAGAGLVPAGFDFPINEITAHDQGRADIAAQPGGGFVAVWSTGPVNGDTDIAARLFDDEGLPAGPEWTVNEVTAGAQAQPSVSTAVDGSFVVVWMGETATVSGSDIFARRFDSTGVALGPQFTVHLDTDEAQSSPSIARDALDRFTIAWVQPASASPDPWEHRMRFRRFDASGTPLSGDIEFVDAPSQGHGPRIALSSTGEVLLAWQSSDFSGPIHARLHDTSGVAISPRFSTGPAASEPVAHRVPGGFLVAYEDEPAFSAYSNIYLVRLNAAGTVTAGPFQVSMTPQNTVEYALSPAISVAADGSYAVSWTENTRYGLKVLFGLETLETWARRFDSNDMPREDPFAVGHYLAATSHGSRVLINDAGSLTVTYRERGDFSPASVVLHSRDGDVSGLFGRRFCDENDAACDRCPGHDDSLDADGDGVADGCDTCTNVVGERTFDRKVRLSISSDPLTTSRTRPNSAKFAAEVVVTGGFAAFDPLSNGARLRVENAFGDDILDVSMVAAAYGGSGTAGWKATSSGTKWTYLDRRPTPTNGLRKVAVSDRSTQGADSVALRVTAKGGSYPVKPVFIPVRASFTFGGTDDAAAGKCGETAFGVEDCSASDLRLSCEQ